jgi:hypothetical protein
MVFMHRPQTIHPQPGSGHATYHSGSGEHAFLCGADEPWRRCSTCAHFGYELGGANAVWCAVKLPGCVKAQSEHGCADWMREPGADGPDEL